MSVFEKIVATIGLMPVFFSVGYVLGSILYRLFVGTVTAVFLFRSKRR